MKTSLPVIFTVGHSARTLDARFTTARETDMNYVTGSRIDVRSVSRVGKSDVGTNARRIDAFLARLNSRD